METFKAVEKEMKTKAFSKEGLQAAAKLDPKEQEKMEIANFLSDMVDELTRQIESTEAEQDTLQAGAKKGKKDTSKADRLSELDRIMERHKWHLSKLEILLRSLENGSVETSQVKDIEEGIKYYVEQNQEVDFVEDEEMYDDLNLDEEEDFYGIGADNDKLSSQDAQSIQDEPPDTEPAPRTGSVSLGGKGKSASVSETSAPVRRPSVQLKSPLPALSTLHSSLPNTSVGKPEPVMKPAPLPTIPTGQPLKYASAAAAAAASDRMGIAPLPPPPGASRNSENNSPAVSTSQPAAITPSPSQQVPQPAKAPEVPPKQATPAPKEEPRISEPPYVKPSPAVPKVQPVQQAPTAAVPAVAAPLPTKATQPPSPDSGIAGIALSNGEPAQEEEEEESIYHLPSSLTDLLDSFEDVKKRATSDTVDLSMLAASRANCPIPMDAEKPNHYKPQSPYAYTPAHYPQEPLGIFDDPRLYSRIDTDSLFYAFYYRQGTYQQYLAAKALKSQSWRFHKQYQTWFQRHEEPKTITEEFEQGTYRFFDYESTW
jgi:CCR4-NOT transcription complex subunit 3